jgi:hypothetical protein
MTYGRFISILNFFWCHAINNFGRDSILDIRCCCHYFCMYLWTNFICCNIHRTFLNKCSIFPFSYTIMFWQVCNGYLLHNVILLVECIEIVRVIFPTSITCDCLDILSSLILYQSLKDLKIVKHTKLILMV